MSRPLRVSVHGGHSGQFCNHATDSLEQIVTAYITQQFSWVGITEHSPAIRQDLHYPDEIEAGYTPQYHYALFTKYIEECRRLQKKYRDKIALFVGIEIETYSGYETFIADLLKKFKPDYLVGSVHFVDDIPFDYSMDDYARAIKHCGGVEALYCRYFDLQFDMLQSLKPAVVGHFDLIRIYDPDYIARLERPSITARIERNLRFIAKHNLIMDYNVRAMLKGADEPYISETILKKAHRLGIAVVPGDDSHGVDSVGTHIDEAIALLKAAGFDTNWQRPRLY